MPKLPTFRIHGALLMMCLLTACGKKEPPPLNVEATLEEAGTRLRNNKIKDAERLYLHILERQPEQPDAVAGMARVRAAEKDHESAVVLYKRALAAKSGDATIHGDLGISLANMDRHQEAADEFGKAFEIDPENSYYGLQYGAQLNKAGNFAPAEPVLRRVADLDPLVHFVYTELGDSLRGQDKLDEALKTYMKAQSTHASDKRAHAGAALVYEAKGDTRHAVDEWSSYIRMDCCSEYSVNVAKKKITELGAAEQVPQQEG